MNKILEFFVSLWQVFSEMSPYLLFGFFVAGILSVFLSSSWVERHLGGSGFFAVLKASAFGVPLPLCSCGVIPVAASLRRHGAGKGATTAFLISTPQTGVDSIMVTLSLLGWVYAIFRPIVALISGLIGGVAINLLCGHDDTPEPVQEKPACCSDCSGDSGISDKMSLKTDKSKSGRVLSYAFIDLPRDIGKMLLLGLVISATITVIVPEDFFAGWLGTGFTGMIVMMLIAIPMYVCATASVPIALSLIAKGVSPGAGLVFLMTGPATNAATIAMIWKVMGTRTAIVYLSTVALCAIGGGAILDLLIDRADVTSLSIGGFMLPVWVKMASAVVLAGVLAAAIIPPVFRKISRWF